MFSLLKFVCIFVRDIFVTFVLFLFILTKFLNLFPRIYIFVTFITYVV